MISSRCAGILLALAFLSVALYKAVRTDAEPPVSRVEAARQEQVRRFWDTYRAASQKRSLGDLDGAIGLYERALRLKPDHEDSLYYLGNSYFARRRFREAKATYERLIAVNRLGSSRGYVQLALLHADLGPGAPMDLEKAARYFQQALDIDSDSGALLGVGEVALLRGARRDARTALLGVNAENGASVAAPYLLGYLAWREGTHDEAWRWFRLAVKRCKVKKPPVPWSEEGDVKADPELRWLALARQSVFGSHWLRLRQYLNAPGLSPTVMEREYSRFQRLAARRRRASLRGEPGSRGWAASDSNQ